MLYLPKLYRSRLLEENLKSAARITINQGGSSSGKTYSILQTLIEIAAQSRCHISVCAVSMPHLKKGAMRDFINILEENDRYDEALHNKSTNTFRIPVTDSDQHSIIEFFSLDQSGKARGPRRDFLFINEANLIPWETYNQLAIRTRKRIYLDYNPADEFHWIYDRLLTRKDIKFIHSTYKDNPFIDPNIVVEIERLQEIDPNGWTVYGLGEIGKSSSLVYPNWEFIDEIPEKAEIFYGLDFGFNDPTACIRIGVLDQVLYLEEVLYQSNLLNSEVISHLNDIILPDHAYIYADTVPDKIQEIQRARFNIRPSNKDVKYGISRVKDHKILVTKHSENLIKELRSYKWKSDPNGRIFDEPFKDRDHLLDALRYAVVNHLRPGRGEYIIH